jgi:hypothetical protein
MNKQLISDVISVLRTSETDYRAFAQLQIQKGQPDNSADYRRRAERCHEIAQRLEAVGAPVTD